MPGASDLIDAPFGRELVLTRVFDAPRALVFQAWTDPRHVARWWGPKCFTNPVCEWDARPGGSIHVEMTAPDGVVYPMKGRFHEVAPPERLVFTSTAFEDAEGRPQLEVINTITLVEHEGRTTLTLRAKLIRATPETAAALGGMETGWSQSLDKLAEHLAREVAGTSEFEIVSSRVFDASRELVWQAFSDPNHLVRWWGPKGFTNTTHEFDLRPGGWWRHTMHGPDGTDYRNESVFVEVVEPERIVFDHERTMHRFRMTITFAELGGRTLLTWRMRFESAEECAKVRTFAVEANEQNFDRLQEQLTMMADTEDVFEITRTVNAPRDLVFAAWTDVERLKQWWGPKGFTMLACKNDLRPGGLFHYGMTAPDGAVMWGKWVYREIMPPERLVFVSSFSDEQGQTLRAPFSADWPLEVLSTVTFAEQDGRTTITLRGIPLNATDTERAFFKGMHGSMQQGWTGTLDQLAAYLAKS